MSIWARLSNVPALELLVPKEKDSVPQLVWFHLSITMGYLEFTPLFFTATETVKDLEISGIHTWGLSPEHPFKNWRKYSHKTGTKKGNTRRRSWITPG